MAVRKNYQIMLKLGTLLGGFLILSLFLVGLSLSHSREVMLNERKNTIRDIVDSTISIAKYHQRLVQNGLLSKEEAQDRVKDIVRSIRYGKDGYLYIFNADKVVLVHPLYREKEGVGRFDAPDSEGIPFIDQLFAAARSGGGYTFYHFQKPNILDKSYPKLSYSQTFIPWEWMFGTGVYIDDIDKAYIDRLKTWMWIISPLFLILIGLTYFLGWTIIGPIVQLEQSKQRAESATRAKSDFLANVSHEIRTPLNGAMGMVALMLGSNLSPQQREWAQIAYQSSEELLNLINDILDISKVEAGQMVLEKVPFDLQSTLKTVTNLLYPRAQRKGVRIFVAFQPDLPRFVVGDPVRLRQILMNLVGNAVKFTSEGYILISVEGEKKEEGYFLKFEVKDTGPGIPEDKQKYIFEKFSQAEESTTRNFGGTGLGLAICRELTKIMGGEVGVRSVVGQGSTFWFTVFFEQDVGLVPITTNLPGGRALIDCPDETLRRILGGYLLSRSYQCDFPSPAQGIEMMLHQSIALGNPYDLLFLDIESYLDNLQALSARLHSLANQSPTSSLILITPPETSLTKEGLDLKQSVALLSRPVFLHDLWEVISLLLKEKGSNRPPELIVSREDVSLNLMPDGKVDEGQTDKLILVAEDQKINQMLMRTVLSQLGCSCDVASNGFEAVRMAAGKQYDLIFMDGHMPEMDGLEATKQIREFEMRLRRHTPIIALTADAMKGDRDKCLAAGMDDYLHKPVKAAQIKEMIDKHTRRKP